MAEIIKGSVKDLIITSQPTKYNQGVGVFKFSDRYSVFDWGEMPDHIPEKGTVLAMIGAYNFEMLENQGIKTHYIGLLDRYGRTCTLQELLNENETSNQMIVKLSRKIQIANNYENYLKDNNNFLIPLEIIFRNGLPTGSSIFRKLKKAKNKTKQLEKILFSLGLRTMPSKNQWLNRPVYDFSTKLEERDRPLNYEEALRISGLTTGKFGELLTLAEKTNTAISKQCNTLGLEHWDGKIEVTYHNNELIIADVCGTPDESRISRHGKQLSKEPLRTYYKTTSWYGAVCFAKKMADETGNCEWKQMCTEKPEQLPDEITKAVEQMYKATLNHWVDKKVFRVPKLDITVEKLDEEVREYEKI